MDRLLNLLQPMLMPAGIGIVVIVVLTMLLYWNAPVLFLSDQDAIQGTKSFATKAMWRLILVVVIVVALRLFLLGTNLIPSIDAGSTPDSYISSTGGVKDE